MYTSVDNLLRQPLMEGAKVLAGGKGLNRIVGDFTVLDSPDAADFLTGVEFIVTSGYIYLNNMVDLKDILTNLDRIGTPCIGVYTRFFGSSGIPQVIKNHCDKLGMPLIEMPEDVTFMQMSSLIKSNFLSKKTGVIKSYTTVFNQLAESLTQGGIQELLKTLNYWSSYPVVFVSENEFLMCPTDGDMSGIIKNLKFLTWEHDPEYIYPGVAKLELHEQKKEIIYCRKIVDLDETFIIFIADEGVLSMEDYRLLSYVTMLNSPYAVLRLPTKQFVKHFFQAQYPYSEAASIAKRSNTTVPPSGSVVLVKPNQELNQKQFTVLRHLAIKIFGADMICGKVDQDLFAMFVSQTKQEFSSMMGQMYIEMKRIFPNFSISIFIGNEYPYEDLMLSYQEAQRTQKISSIYQRDQEIYYYEELGLYRLVDIARFDTALPLFVNDQLMAFDRIDHSGDLIKTLVSYLNNAQSYPKTATELFLHPNTVRYRISIIEKQCKINLSDAWERINLELALYFRMNECVKNKEDM
jgi:purine catabolism regulator